MVRGPCFETPRFARLLSMRLRGGLVRTRLHAAASDLRFGAGQQARDIGAEVFVTDDGAETDLDLGHYEDGAR